MSTLSESRPFISVGIAVLTVSDTRTPVKCGGYFSLSSSVCGSNAWA